MHNYTQMNTMLTLIAISNTFIKSDILTQPLIPPKNQINIFKNQKSNATSQPPIQYTTIHQCTSITKHLCLQRYGPISTSTPHILWTSKFELFNLMNPKIQTSKIPSSSIIPNPNWTKNSLRSWIDTQFDHKAGKHILLEDPAWRWFDFTHSDFARLFQKLTNQSKPLKSPRMPWWLDLFK